MLFISENQGGADLAQVFVQSRRDLETALRGIRGRLKPAALLWITYPKGTSGVRTDVNRDVVREYAEGIGFKAVALVSVDDTWSALRLKIV